MDSADRVIFENNALERLYHYEIQPTYTNLPHSILVYGGEGVNEFCLKTLINKAKELLDSNYHNFVIVRSDSELKNRLFTHLNKPEAVFVPGGIAGFIKLNDEKTPWIKEVIKTGVKYFGVCAGGVISAQTKFSRLGSFVIDEQGNRLGEKKAFSNDNDRGLNLLPIEAFTPILTSSTAFDISTKTDFIKVIDIDIAESQGTPPLKVLNVLGPGFDPLDEKVKVVSRYCFQSQLQFGDMKWDSSGSSDRRVKFYTTKTVEKPQLAETVFWKENETSGMACAIGSHYECDSAVVRSSAFKQEFSKLSKEEQESLASQLEPSDKARNQHLKSLWVSLGLRVKSSS